MRTRWRAARRVTSSKKRTLPEPPCALAKYIAASASLSSASMLIMSSSTRATPMLTDDVELFAREVERLVERAADALGDRGRGLAVADVLAQDRRTRRRRSATACRSCAAPLRRRCATCFNSSSPVWCPNVSFTSLNRLRSRNITTGGLPPRRRISSIAWLSRSTRSWRFGQTGQPVVQRLVREQRLDLLLGLAGRAGHADRDREHERAEEADRLGVRRRHERRRPADAARASDRPRSRPATIRAPPRQVAAPDCSRSANAANAYAMPSSGPQPDM